jgi:hypothetical protein
MKMILTVHTAFTGNEEEHMESWYEILKGGHDPEEKGEDLRVN